MEGHILDAQVPKELVGHGDGFHIGGRIFRAKALNPNLVKFPQTTSLGTLIAKHGADIVELDGLLNLWRKKFVFHKGTDYWCGPFWTQGDVAVPLVIEIIHLLGYDISGIPNRTRNDLVMLKHGRPNFPIVVFLKGFTGQVLHILPSGSFQR